MYLRTRDIDDSATYRHIRKINFIRALKGLEVCHFCDEKGKFTEEQVEFGKNDLLIHLMENDLSNAILFIKEKGIHTSKGIVTLSRIFKSEIFGGKLLHKSTSTEIKESLVTFFFQERIKTFDRESCLFVLENANMSYEKDEVKGYLKKFFQEMKKSNDLLIEESLKIANYLREHFPNYEIDRHVHLSRIKKNGSCSSGLFPDKWNPSDIILYPSIDIVHSNIDEMFSDEFTENGKVVGVSLKQTQSRAGRGKSFFKDKTSSNLTSEEFSLPKEEIISKISEYRDFIFMNLQGWNIIENDGSELSSLIEKFSATKLVKHFVEEHDFEELLNFCLSIHNNPPFFKVKVQNGEASHHLFKNKKFKLIKKIAYSDKNKNKYISFEFFASNGEELYKGLLDFRTNGNAQCQVEMRRWEKILL